MKHLRLLSTLIMSCCGSFAFAQLVVTPITDADELADILIGDASGITVVSTTLTAAAGSCGSFSGGDFGFEEGILLTSGSVGNAVGPNINGGITTNNGAPGAPGR